MLADGAVFVDTNVILYSIDWADPVKCKEATAWLEYLWRTGSGRISWQVLHEFYVNGRKFGLGEKGVRDLVELFAAWTPIDTSFGLAQRAWHWMDSAKISYWDSLIVAAAERAGCAVLLSEDLQAGRKFGSMVVVNPFRISPPQ